MRRDPGVGFRQPERMREAWTNTGRRETRRLGIVCVLVACNRESTMTTAQPTTTLSLLLSAFSIVHLTHTPTGHNPQGAAAGAVGASHAPPAVAWGWREE